MANTPLLREKELLLELRDDNQKAFEELYYLYSPRLFGKLLKLVKLESYAQEILQDVFLKVWEHRKSIDPEKSFRSFLFKIAENKAYDFFRKAAREKNWESQLIAFSLVNYNLTEEDVSQEESLRNLEKAIAGLSPQRQQVFRLCKLQGKSYKQVSDLMGISVSTISDHIVKGTKSIRESLERDKGPDWL